MNMLKLTFWTRVSVAFGLALASHSHSWAQGVFKCTVAGKTTYQSSPCTGQGKELDIAPGPTEQQIQEAKMRANAEKARVGSPQPPARQRAQNQFVGRKVDCAKLNKDRGDAFGRRNAAVRSSRESNIDQSSTVSQAHDDIRFIENRILRDGCKPD
jgi:hypothetical protein